MWVATTIRFYGGRLLYSSTATKYGRWVGVVGEGTTETPTDEILAVRPYSLYRDYLCLYWATGDLRTKTTERIRLMNIFSKVPLPWLSAIAFHNPTLERYSIVLGKISEIRPGFELGLLNSSQVLLPLSYQSLWSWSRQLCLSIDTYHVSKILHFIHNITPVSPAHTT